MFRKSSFGFGLTITLTLLSIAILISCAPAPTPAPTAAPPTAAPQPATSTAVPSATSASPAASQAIVPIRFGIYSDPAREVVAKAQADAFNKAHPNIAVTVEAVPFSDYYKKLGIAMASGDAWDVFMINAAYFRQMAPQGNLKDLTDLVKKANLNIDDYTVDPGNTVYKGKTLSLPYELNMMGLFYNKDLFDAAKVTYPTDKWTWDDLLQASQKLTKTDGGKTVQWGFYSENNYPSLHDFIAQNGGAMFNDDFSKSRINEPAAVDALQFMVDLVQKYKVSPLPADMPAGVDPFMTGKVAMVISYSFSVQPDLKAPFKWAIAPLPIGKKKAYGYWTQAISVFTGSKNADAAWSFAQYLMSQEAMEIMAKQRGATPSLKKVAQSSLYTQAPPDGMDVFIKEYNDAASPVPLPAQFGDLMSGPTSVNGVNFTPAWNGQISVKDAADKAAAATNKIFASP
jgi:multiple sugar transport system substrate-binding protein